MLNYQYCYPNGTTSSTRPTDGQTWTRFSNSGLPEEVWQWDDFMGQWVDITNGATPTTLQAATKTLHSQIAIDLSSINIAIDLAHIECECGSDKCGSNKHSNWCPKYDINT